MNLKFTGSWKLITCGALHFFMAVNAMTVSSSREPMAIFLGNYFCFSHATLAILNIQLHLSSPSNQGWDRWAEGIKIWDYSGFVQTLNWSQNSSQFTQLSVEWWCPMISMSMETTSSMILWTQIFFFVYKVWWPRLPVPYFNDLQLLLYTLTVHKDSKLVIS